MFDNPTYAQAIFQAEHRIAIGMTDVYLSSDDGLDWSKCVGMETGGSHRFDIATDVVFIFNDAGLRLRWHFDIEPRTANGSSHYQIDTAGIQRILAALQPAPKRQFKAYLASCVEAVEKQANEYQQIATKEYGMAGALRAAASEAVAA